MYYLMNKNNIVATLNVNPQSAFSDNTSFTVNEIYSKLPFSCNDITKWLEKRKASKHNAHLGEIMSQLGCDDNEGFIRVTHAASINDTFWVKSDKEKISWEQVSLYRNQFSETISKLAFEGIGLYGIELSSTTPELTCDGSFRKCFRKEETIGERGSDIFLYKRNREIGAGLEVHCELLASEIAQIISPENAIRYDLATLHGKLASRCNLFTDEQYGYASYHKITGDREGLLPDVFEYFRQIGSERTFRELLVIDSLCFNFDRHMGNYGVLFDNDTLEIVGMSPIFDLNLSFLPYICDEDFAHIGDKLYRCGPKLGDDFTRIGQMAVNGLPANDILRERIESIKDFSFTFRGDDVFSGQRVKHIENMVRKQAEAILSNEKLFTKDVFFSEKVQSEILHQKELKEQVTIASKLLNGFMNKLDITLYEDEGYVSMCNDSNTVQCFIEKNNFALTVDFLKGDMWVTDNDKLISIKEVKKLDAKFYETCGVVQKMLKLYMKEMKNHTFSTFFQNPLINKDDV